MWEKTGVHVFTSFNFVLHFVTHNLRDTRHTILLICVCECKIFARTEDVDQVILVLEPGLVVI
jgi:hypothetical protein